MIVCEYCGWRGSGEHDCKGNLIDRLESVVEERNHFEEENVKLMAERDAAVARANAAELRLDMLKLGQFRRGWLDEAEELYEEWREERRNNAEEMWALRCRELLQALQRHAGVAE